MTSEQPYGDDFALESRVSSYLANPSMWERPDPLVQAAIVASIAAQTPTTEASGVRTTAVPVARTRRWTRPFIAGAAAALVLIAGLVAASQLRSSSGDIELTLVGTELAPNASAEVVIDTTPVGTRLKLEVSGLGPPPDGQYYEAWVRKDGDVGVSAGTFHMRGGDGSVELWAGVLVSDYPLITVTIQDEADTTSSGVVVLKGTAEP